MNTDKLKRMIRETIESSRSDFAKRIEIIAIITEAMKDIGVKPVIVGGHAVEFYTSGGYATMDIDMLCTCSIYEVNSILKSLGFDKEGKYWVLTDENIDIAIEVPSGPLAGDSDRLTKVEINEGLNAYFIGIEDIIIDRLNRYKHWGEYSDEEWIIGMIILNHEEIDWEYVYKRAEEERTLEEIQEFRKKSEEDMKEMKD
ncbi:MULTISPECIES: DUF6036 family nucleotidyltransferase [unclassified Candidatus Frackibacter]|uniref:DUF6036 family nucleotidyltransferase n=1 Tax=unclassified Candidatus Frackibacter TaxID=2648818 RepID=UPI0008824D96|nr:MULTISPECIES: DUF6036 family nucleotidyltransferase [unclassified Candidatus Frackibacter]SDC27440.1 hypothetical protein SAMN04515661_10571 [Candidatus Frackibacter sp. WG11]SEM54384.1 hypothetical protein SAMN04488698_10672 [Candidatus Frackibacter sp. WG12]SFL53999.1 hypothetical protein SAMN04488699_10522 [Candidatus Frackibacter sp. WG13]